MQVSSRIQTYYNFINIVYTVCRNNQTFRSNRFEERAEVRLSTLGYIVAGYVSLVSLSFLIMVPP